MEHHTLAMYGKLGGIVSGVMAAISLTAALDGAQKIVAVGAGLVSMVVGVLAGRYYIKARRKLN